MSPKTIPRAAIVVAASFGAWPGWTEGEEYIVAEGYSARPSKHDQGCLASAKWVENANAKGLQSPSP